MTESTTTTIEPRNLRFPIDAAVPRYWLGGKRSVSLFCDNLSIFFPPGERFFIQSVRAHRHVVRDPQLAKEVEAFYAQEGFHTREHMRYNAHLRELGFPVEAMESRVASLLAFVKRIVSPRLQLAATAALEHFTALMADSVLGDPRVLEGADPTMAALWRWHSAEENEHKGVAFDVFVAAGGNYVERVAAMIVATIIFWMKVAEHQVRLMHADGILFSLREWLALGRFLFWEPGLTTSLARHYFAYYKPGFHPWQHDNRDLLEAWKAGLAPQDEPTTSA